MSRLWQDEGKRVGATAVGAGGSGAGPGSPEPPPAAPLSDYLERLSKLVPTEILGAYVAMNAFAPNHPRLDFWVGLALVPTYLFLAAGPGTRKVLQVAIATVSFVIWALTMYGTKTFPGIDPEVMAVVLIAYTLIAPSILRKWSS